MWIPALLNLDNLNHLHDAFKHNWRSFHACCILLHACCILLHACCRFLHAWCRFLHACCICTPTRALKKKLGTILYLRAKLFATRLSVQMSECAVCAGWDGQRRSALSPSHVPSFLACAFGLVMMVMGLFLQIHFLSSTPTLIRYLGGPVYWLCWRTVDYINICTPLSQQCSITGPVPRELLETGGSDVIVKGGKRAPAAALLWPSVQQNVTVTDFLKAVLLLAPHYTELMQIHVIRS